MQKLRNIKRNALKSGLMKRDGMKIVDLKFIKALA